MDRGDVPDLSVASARRVAGWGLRRAHGLRTRLRFEAAPDAERAPGARRTLPALSHGSGLVLLESGQRTAKTALVRGGGDLLHDLAHLLITGSARIAGQVGLRDDAETAPFSVYDRDSAHLRLRHDLLDSSNIVIRTTAFRVP